MSFIKTKSIIEVGDTVLVYLSPKQMYSINVKEDDVYQTRFGALRHDDLIGKPYGSKIQCSKGFVHILDVTPELWTLTLPHRTQILYSTDISFILIQLQLKPGSVVVEAGTGSGSLSHSIARTIFPNGKLITYDFHQERVEAAREEFKDHGLDSIVCVQHRDVCTDGFNVDTLVDAIFLDLPHPWEAIPSADLKLKNGGRICCFSPCIEQVQKSCQVLNNLHFMDIETFECVARPHEVRHYSLKKYTYDPDSLAKKANISSDTNAPDNASQDDNHKNNNKRNNRKRKLEQDQTDDLNNEKDPNSANYLISYMNNEIPGHTGFLTFATKFTTNI